MTPVKLLINWIMCIVFSPIILLGFLSYLSRITFNAGYWLGKSLFDWAE